MNLKLFYSPPKWFGFVPPEKPRQWDYESGGDPPIIPAYVDPSYYDAMYWYEYGLKKAKANALEVGNYGEIYTIVNDSLDREITLPCTEIDGVEYFDWKGSAVIKDGKYILSV